MEQLLPYYQEELATLRRDCREFAARYPRVAGMLGMAEDACGDPHVERLIQACALLSARVARQLDDGYPRLIESVLETTYPHYLRPFPSCSIVCFDQDARGMLRTETIPRGTVLRSQPVGGTPCRFTTSSDVMLSPLTVESARFAVGVGAPADRRVDSKYDAVLSIRFATSVPLASLGMERLRLFIDADPSFRAALHDALFLRTGPAFVQLADAGPWHTLRAFPLQQAGLGESDALLPWPARSHPAYRLLTEYFSFPEKFHFIDVDLANISAALPPACTSFTLHLPLRGMARNDAAVRNLGTFDARHLRTHCTAVVNLYSREASPITAHGRATEYPLVIDVGRPASCELYAIEAARLVSGKGSAQKVTPLRAFYGPFHGQGKRGEERYWVTRRDEVAAACSPGHEIRIAIVDDDMQDAPADAKTLSVDVTCTNRDLPVQLPFGAADGDLKAAGILDRTPIRFLRKPTPSRRFPADQRAHSRLVAHLTLNQRSLSEIGLEELRKMLSLYDLPHSPVTQRQIAGIVSLAQSTVHEWVQVQRRKALMPGIEIRIGLDEDAYVGGGLYVFAQVLDRFFALYGQINVFTRLVLVSAGTGEELLTCAPRTGTMALA